MCPEMSTETENRGWGHSGWGLTSNGHRVSFWGHETALELDGRDGHSVCVDCCQPRAHVEMADFILRAFHLSNKKAVF